jgi:6-phosphogluconolactonase (cycloisomerase 2 family)
MVLKITTDSVKAVSSVENAGDINRKRPDSPKHLITDCHFINFTPDRNTLLMCYLFSTLGADAIDTEVGTGPG